MGQVGDEIEQMRRIVTLLAQYQAGLELTGHACRLCLSAPHEPDCPACLAWALTDEEGRAAARRQVQEWLDRPAGAEPDRPEFLRVI